MGRPRENNSHNYHNYSTGLFCVPTEINEAVVMKRLTLKSGPSPKTCETTKSPSSTTCAAMRSVFRQRPYFTHQIPTIHVSYPDPDARRSILISNCSHLLVIKACGLHETFDKHPPSDHVRIVCGLAKDSHWCLLCPCSVRSNALTLEYLDI